ncbi:MAG: hypothetical protein K2O14_12965 [Oscillospiraceae bacterium]|nr:hypothetical protein [Oscillospiraceae bacterium]
MRCLPNVFGKPAEKAGCAKHSPPGYIQTAALRRRLFEGCPNGWPPSARLWILPCCILCRRLIFVECESFAKKALSVCVKSSQTLTVKRRQMFCLPPPYY